MRAFCAAEVSCERPQRAEQPRNDGMGLGRMPAHVLACRADRGSSILGAEMSALSVRIGRGASRLPADIALSLIPSLPRATLERLAQQIIDHLDDMDPDPDVEPNGDEQDGNQSEDDFMDHGERWKQEPGCPIADPGEGSNRTFLCPTLDGEDQSFVIVPAPRGIEPTRWRIS